MVLDQRGGQSWEFTTEGRSSEVGVGGWACVLGGRELGFGFEKEVRVGNPSQKVGVRMWEWGAGHAYDRTRSLVSDQRRRSELGIHHRG